MLVYRARPFLALVLYMQGKGLAKVTFDWILTDQSDLTAQNLGSNYCMGEGSQSSAYSRSRASCCFHLDYFVWRWSTSTTEATTDDLDNCSSSFSRAGGLSITETGVRRSPFKANTYCHLSVFQTSCAPWKAWVRGQCYLCTLWWSSRSSPYQQSC